MRDATIMDWSHGMVADINYSVAMPNKRVDSSEIDIPGCCHSLNVGDSAILRIKGARDCPI